MATVTLDGSGGGGDLAVYTDDSHNFGRSTEWFDA